MNGVDDGDDRDDEGEGAKVGGGSCLLLAGGYTAFTCYN